MSTLPRKLVVAALCTDARGRVLLTKRLPDQPMGGLWELPGGKVEQGEAPSVALAREIAEELDCECRVGSVYDVVHHVYPSFELVLVVYRVELAGTPSARQVERLAWIVPSELERYEVLPADVELVRVIARRGHVDPRPVARTFEQLTHNRQYGGLGAHYLRVRLDEEIDRAARYTRPLSLVLVDIDDLGAINDRHGRAVGDEVVAQLVAVTTDNARAIDRVGSFSRGGFAIVLPETPSGAALGIAERLRAEVAAHRFTVTASAARIEVRCTVSCGVASTRGGPGADTMRLEARADAALWRAKVAGRNRTVVDSSGLEL
ncbi:MAG: diguanylate cyclase [Polyangia bacterium]